MAEVMITEQEKATLDALLAKAGAKEYVKSKIGGATGEHNQATAQDNAGYNLRTITSDVTLLLSKLKYLRWAKEKYFDNKIIAKAEKDAMAQIAKLYPDSIDAEIANNDIKRVNSLKVKEPKPKA